MGCLPDRESCGSNTSNALLGVDFPQMAAKDIRSFFIRSKVSVCRIHLDQKPWYAHVVHNIAATRSMDRRAPYRRVFSTKHDSNCLQS
jgi:hypothetical protein